jgi:hypothetical protein
MNMGIWLWTTAMLACAPEGEDPPIFFEVASVDPSDGRVDVVESKIPELRLNEDTDPDLCPEGSIRLLATDEDGLVLFEIPVSYTFYDGGRRVQLRYDDTLPDRTWYSIVVETWTQVCVDINDNELEPFTSRFYVP